MKDCPRPNFMDIGSFWVVREWQKVRNTKDRVGQIPETGVWRACCQEQSGLGRHERWWQTGRVRPGRSLSEMILWRYPRFPIVPGMYLAYPVCFWYIGYFQYNTWYVSSIPEYVSSTIPSMFHSTYLPTQLNIGLKRPESWFHGTGKLLTTRTEPQFRPQKRRAGRRISLSRPRC